VRAIASVELARDLGLSRLLLHMPLKRWEAAGLVPNKLEVSDDGKAMNYFELRPPGLRLTPGLTAGAVPTLASERGVGDAVDVADKEEERR
jgi:hypothetical protein